MKITRTQNNDGGDCTVALTLEGKLDTTTAPTLQEALLPELKAGANVVLDFAGVTYVSSAGLRVLLKGEKTAKSNSARQVLTNVSAIIMEVLEMTGFAAILNFEK